MITQKNISEISSNIEDLSIKIYRIVEEIYQQTPDQEPINPRNVIKIEKDKSKKVS